MSSLTGNFQVDRAGSLTGTNGSGGAHNNIQPSIVVKMWKRTA